MGMTNLEHFKRGITAENLCDKIMCSECPFFGTSGDKKPCTTRLTEWARQEYTPAKREA